MMSFPQLIAHLSTLHMSVWFIQMIVELPWNPHILARLRYPAIKIIGPIQKEQALSTICRTSGWDPPPSLTCVISMYINALNFPKINNRLFGQFPQINLV